MSNRSRIPDEEAAEILRQKDQGVNTGDAANVEEVKSANHKNTIKEHIDKSEGGLGALKSETSQISGANDIGWKNVPIENLPTMGLFYPEGAEVTIKSADVEEIRHWSTIDETDMIDMDDKMNFILEKCVRFRLVAEDKEPFSMHWKDLKEIDRFYIVILIHELTFPGNDNKLHINFRCISDNCLASGNPYRSKEQLKSNMLNLFRIADDIMKYYNSEERKFVIESKKLGKTFQFTVPQVGVSSYVKNYIYKKRRDGDALDTAFVKVAPFILEDWRQLNDKSFERERMNSFKWNKNDWLFISAFTDKLEDCVKLQVDRPCPKCGETIEAPLFFRGGFTIKDLFSISGQLDDLI